MVCKISYKPQTILMPAPISARDGCRRKRPAGPGKGAAGAGQRAKGPSFLQPACIRLMRTVPAEGEYGTLHGYYLKMGPLR